MGLAIGIDLGTTNSVACYYDGTEPRILLNTFQEELTPSVVAMHRLDDDEEGEIAVGASAVSQAKLFPKDTIYSIKRLMGRPFNKKEVQEWKTKVNYDVVGTEEHKGLATVRMGGKEYLPEEISALILKNIKAYAERVLGQEVTHAVVTVPAYFGEPERAATRDAGRKAGLVVKTLLPEPTAAAIAFGAQAKANERFVLVYDLGGGTFDISVLSIVQREDGSPGYNVMTVGGDHFLGGDDFDRVIVDMILDHVKKKYGVDLSGDARFLTIAKQEAEKAKKALSAEESAPILAPQAAHSDGKDINISMRVTRDEFESKIRPLVERATKLVSTTLRSQQLTPDLIDDVLLVGGSTSVPAVGKSMEDMFGRDKVRRNVNPMHCVAVGAGILSGRMKGVECPKCKATCDEANEKCSECGHSLAVARAALDKMEIQDIANNHFGIQAVRGSDPYAFFPLVEKGTVVPMKDPCFKTVYTVEADQQKLRVPVFEGLGASVLQNSLIGVIEYPLTAGMPINEPVRVGLQVDRSSIVKVTIEVESFNIRHEQELKRELIDDFTQAEDDKLLDDDEEVDDTERNLVILERYVERAERFRSEYDSLLGGLEKRRLDKAIEEGREVCNEENGSKANQVIMKIDQVLNSCGTASLIEQARLVATSAPRETSEKLNNLADQMRECATSGNTAALAQLRDPVASLIRQEHKRAMQIDQVETAKTYDGLLGDKR